MSLLSTRASTISPPTYLLLIYNFYRFRFFRPLPTVCPVPACVEFQIIAACFLASFKLIALPVFGSLCSRNLSRIASHTAAGAMSCASLWRNKYSSALRHIAGSSSRYRCSITSAMINLALSRLWLWSSTGFVPRRIICEAQSLPPVSRSRFSCESKFQFVLTASAIMPSLSL